LMLAFPHLKNKVMFNKTKRDVEIIHMDEAFFSQV
jgi:hypothetical protein